jgi:predicted GNAT family acetyltransferase
MARQVRDNEARSRFELDVSGQIVFANYRRRGTDLLITHVEAPPALRGHGFAGALMQEVLEIARAEGREIVPLCGYAAAWMRQRRAAPLS